jgi:hypothetical protein
VKAVLDSYTLVVSVVAWAMWKQQQDWVASRDLASGSAWHALKLDVTNIHFPALNSGYTERTSAFHPGVSSGLCIRGVLLEVSVVPSGISCPAATLAAAIAT